MDLSTFVLKTLALKMNIRSTAFCPLVGGGVNTELPFVFESSWDDGGEEKKSMVVSMALPIVFLWITDAFLVRIPHSHSVHRMALT